jgi:hypothetical protein
MRWLYVIIFVWIFSTSAYFFQGGSWSSNASFDLIRAIVEKGSFNCTDYAYNSGDFIERDGRMIAYKAPGISFLGAPAWALLYWTLGPSITQSVNGLNAGLFFVVLMTTGLAAAWAGVWFFRFCLAIEPGRVRAAAFVTGVFFFGTMMFPFSTLLFGHVTAAAFCWVAFVRATGAVPVSKKWDGVLIGLYLGVAVTVEYLCLPVALAILALAFFQGDKRRLSGIILGAAPMAVALSAYHWNIMGVPWQTPYSKPPEMFSSQAAVGGVFIAPSFETIWHTTFGTFRGVFFSSPVLILGLWGLVEAWRRGGLYRNAAAASIFITALHFVFLWTFNGWTGGWTFGSRYFVPAVPFLAWPILLVIRKAKALTVLFATVSVGLMLVATSVNPQAPAPNKAASNGDVWFNYLFPAFIAGDLADHVQSVDEKYPIYEFWPTGLAFITHGNEKFAPKLQAVHKNYPPEICNPRHEAIKGATNSGINLGLPGLWSLVPLLLLWALMGGLLVHRIFILEKDVESNDLNSSL